MINNLRHTEEYDKLETHIRTMANGRKIIFAPSYGNWGDALILKGTLQFLADRKIEFTVIPRAKIDQIREGISPAGLTLGDAILLSCGGGSWCKNFHGNRDFVQRNASLFAHTIVMPSTFELPAISGGSNRVSYIARDKYDSLETIPDALFCHDMAFYVSLPGSIEVASTASVGYFMREDSEKSGSAKSLGHGYDISLVGNQNSKITPFFHILNGYDKIITDRMHVAIAGAMLGKQVELYAGDYFKAPAVHRSSNEQNYDSVHLKIWQ